MIRNIMKTLDKKLYRCQLDSIDNIFHNEYVKFIWAENEKEAKRKYIYSSNNMISKYNENIVIEEIEHKRCNRIYKDINFVNMDTGDKVITLNRVYCGNCSKAFIDPRECWCKFCNYENLS